MGIKDEVQDKLGIAIPDHIQDLIAERRKDAGKEETLLPKIPSAQAWASFTDEDKAKFRELLTKQGLSADTVLRAHWPKTPNEPPVTKWRVV